MRILLILLALVVSPARAQLDMACYEACTNRPDYCQAQCTKEAPPQYRPYPVPDQGYKPWGGAVGAEAGRREANRDAMELLQMQRLYQENMLRQQQLERQRAPSPGGDGQRCSEHYECGGMLSCQWGRCRPRD